MIAAAAPQQNGRLHRHYLNQPCINQFLRETQAMEIIQRNERGRQGKARAQLLKELREEEKRRRIYDATDQLEMDPEIAAANIQVSQVSPVYSMRLGP